MIKQWGDGGIIARREGSHFGYQALAYDWIPETLTPGRSIPSLRREPESTALHSTFTLLTA